MSEPINDGGPAFPNNRELRSERCNGMSLRDWFAGLAMQGLLSQPLSEDEQDIHFANGLPTGSDVAREAFVMADTMLKARIIVQDASGTTPEAQEPVEPA